MSLQQNDNICVMCRVRPMNNLEKSSKTDVIYSIVKENGITIEHPDKNHHPKPYPFFFDKIFDRTATQIDVFEESSLSLIQNLFEGYNATILAYGQTGSGKTYTMIGDPKEPTKFGIIPRIASNIFINIENAGMNCEFTLKASYVEIYNEKLYDLFATKKIKKYLDPTLKIRDDNGHIFVQHLTEIYIQSKTELIELIKRAHKQRMTAETKMNKASSRSHAVLTITLAQYNVETGVEKMSKLIMVDLAGSEKVRKSGAIKDKKRLKEAVSINSSLSTLGRCMNNLATNANNKLAGKSKMCHVPYMESKLTSLLRDSLGGNCKTTLIINTSPCAYNIDETMSTLRFGNRAKK
eukprot:38345_1